MSNQQHIPYPDYATVSLNCLDATKAILETLLGPGVEDMHHTTINRLAIIALEAVTAHDAAIEAYQQAVATHMRANT